MAVTAGDSKSDVWELATNYVAAILTCPTESILERFAQSPQNAMLTVHLL
jgi:hypothetical protein